MTMHKIIYSLLLLIASTAALAQAPAVQSPLPPLTITDRGELVLQNDDFSFRPWTTEQNPGKVHIVQYFGATKNDSETFKPFTDLLQDTFGLGKYHVTTIINLDAALWGTTGFVVSEVKDSKREHPLSTLVLDEEGMGASKWQLGKSGAGLVILDNQGIVRYFTTQALSAQELTASLELVKSHIGG